MDEQALINRFWDHVNMYNNSVSPTVSDYLHGELSLEQLVRTMPKNTRFYGFWNDDMENVFHSQSEYPETVKRIVRFWIVTNKAHFYKTVNANMPLVALKSGEPFSRVFEDGYLYYAPSYLDNGHLQQDAEAFARYSFEQFREQFDQKVAELDTDAFFENMNRFGGNRCHHAYMCLILGLWACCEHEGEYPGLFDRVFSHLVEVCRVVKDKEGNGTAIPEGNPLFPLYQRLMETGSQDAAKLFSEDILFPILYHYSSRLPKIRELCLLMQAITAKAGACLPEEHNKELAAENPAACLGYALFLAGRMTSGENIAPFDQLAACGAGPMREALRREAGCSVQSAFLVARALAKGLLGEEDKRELIGEVRQRMLDALEKGKLVRPAQPLVQAVTQPDFDVRALSASDYTVGNVQNLRQLFNACYLMAEVIPEAKRILAVLLLILPVESKDNDYRWLRYQAMSNGFRIREECLGKGPRDTVELLCNLGLPDEILLREFVYQLNQYYGFGADTFADFPALRKGDDSSYRAVLEHFSGQFDLLAHAIELLFETFGWDDNETLCSMLLSRSKSIRNKAETLVLSRGEELCRPFIEGIAARKDKNAREAVDRILKQWDNDRRFTKDFVFADAASLDDFVKESYNPRAKNMSWIDDVLFVPVHLKNGENAGENTIRYLVSEYMQLKDLYRIRPCDVVAASLNPLELAGALRAIVEMWISQEAPAKYKNILAVYACYGGDDAVNRLRAWMDDWAERSRGALAAFAASAMALNGGDMALMNLSAIAAKFKNKQVRAAAQKALEDAALSLGISMEELEDRIVPALGFDENGERVFDYGARAFTASLMPDLTVSLMTAEGKAVKSLPKPGKTDDAQKAEAAKAAFSSLKKQLKAVVKNQSSRMERVLMNGRSWDRESWERLFVKNPVMHVFAIGLIWAELDSRGSLLGTFRYLEDGTFNTCEEEEYALSDSGRITLAHPAELEPGVVGAWREQLEDYEIVQPIAQMMLTDVLPNEEQLTGAFILYSKKTTYGKCNTAMTKFGWKRGEILDGGGYDYYYLEDPFLDLGVRFELGGDYAYVGMDFSETIQIERILFTRSQDVQYDDYRRKPEDVAVPPAKVPERFLCSILAQVEQL